MRVAEAAQLYGTAENAGYDPDACAGGRWLCHMLLGDFEAAWRESDAIEQRGRPDPHRFWNGRPFDGRRVLIRCLHGLGDTLQFIRYLPLIRARAASLAVEAQPSLKVLVERSGLADSVITWGELEPPWDQQIEIIELPRVFRTTLATIPRRVPYIRIAGARVASENPVSHPLRAGVVWAASSYNPARSIPFERFQQLFSIPGISFFSLQAGDERSCLRSAPQVTDSHDPSACVFATATAIQSLDLIITVDTMVAHLAGAMAKPVWVLLPFQCDWRWMVEREDSPWYPTMRLFRQPRPGDWDSVLARVIAELNFCAAQRDPAAYSPALAGRVK